MLEQKLHQLLERTDDYSRRISGEAAGSEKVRHTAIDTSLCVRVWLCLLRLSVCLSVQKAHEGGGRESRYHAVSEQEEDAQLLKEAEASEIGADESSTSDRQPTLSLSLCLCVCVCVVCVCHVLVPSFR